MTTIREEANLYEPKTTKNIADLEKVSVDLNVEERTGTDKNGKEFSYKVAVIEGEDYRVPATVLKQLKEQLAEKPDIEEFKVRVSGTGMNTEYTVIAL